MYGKKPSERERKRKFLAARIEHDFRAAKVVSRPILIQSLHYPNALHTSKQSQKFGTFFPVSGGLALVSQHLSLFIKIS